MCSREWAVGASAALGVGLRREWAAARGYQGGAQVQGSVEITHPQGSGQRALGGYALGFCSADAVCGEGAWNSEELGAAVQRVEMLLRRGAVACLCRGRRVVHPWEWLCTLCV